MHPIAQAAEVVEVSPHDDADAAGLLGGEVVGGHADRVPARDGDDNC